MEQEPDVTFDLAEIYTNRHTHPYMHTVLCQTLSEYLRAIDRLPRRQTLDTSDIYHMLERRKVVIMLIDGADYGLRMAGILLGQQIVLPTCIVICVDRLSVVSTSSVDQQKSLERLEQMKCASIEFVSKHQLISVVHDFELVRRSEILWRGPGGTEYERFRWCAGEYVPV